MSALMPVDEVIELVRQFETPVFKLREDFPERGIYGTTARWTVFPDAQTLADYVNYKDPAKFVNRAGMYEKAAAMLHTREKVPIQAMAKFDRKPGSSNSNEPWSLEDQISDEFARMNRRFQRKSEAARAAVLVGGVITAYYPQDNRYATVDFGTSTASHYFSIATPLSVTTVNILALIDTMTYNFQVDTGLDEPFKIVGGRGLWAKLAMNADLKYYWARDPYGMAAITRGEMPRINNIPIIEYRGGYKNSSGTRVDYIPSDALVMYGDPADIGLMTLQGEAIEVEAQGNPGVFGKTWVEQDPSGTMILMDQVELPLVEVPTGIVCARGV
jgi:hypothetical protein